MRRLEGVEARRHRRWRRSASTQQAKPAGAEAIVFLEAIEVAVPPVDAVRGGKHVGRAHEGHRGGREIWPRRWLVAGAAAAVVEQVGGACFRRAQEVDGKVVVL